MSEKADPRTTGLGSKQELLQEHFRTGSPALPASTHIVTFEESGGSGSGLRRPIDELKLLDSTLDPLLGGATRFLSCARNSAKETLASVSHVGPEGLPCCKTSRPKIALPSSVGLMKSSTSSLAPSASTQVRAIFL